MIDRRLAPRMAALGAVLWLASPCFARLAFGSIEHVFMFLPLVATPVALVVIGSAGARLAIAQRVQPIAAVLVLASFALEKGRLAGLLVLPWLVFALTVMARTLPIARRAASRERPSLVALALFLPIGAIWLVLSRMGLGPNGFVPLTVFLAALHFHFSGFAVQTILLGTGRRLTEMTIPYRAAQIGAIAGIPLIAAGNLLAAPALKLFGVALVSASVLVTGALTFVLAKRSDCRIQRTLFSVASISVLAGMLLGLVYGVGEHLHLEIISIPRMVTTHGLLNGIGFTLFALLGHARPSGSFADRRESPTGALLD